MTSIFALVDDELRFIVFTMIREWQVSLGREGRFNPSLDCRLSEALASFSYAPST